MPTISVRTTLVAAYAIVAASSVFFHKGYVNTSPEPVHEALAAFDQRGTTRDASASLTSSDSAANNHAATVLKNTPVENIVAKDATKPSKEPLPKHPAAAEAEEVHHYTITKHTRVPAAEYARLTGSNVQQRPTIVKHTRVPAAEYERATGVKPIIRTKEGTAPHNNGAAQKTTATAPAPSTEKEHVRAAPAVPAQKTQPKITTADNHNHPIASSTASAPIPPVPFDPHAFSNLTANIVATPKDFYRLLDTLVSKWDLSRDAVPLLERIWRKDNSYEPDRDLVVFHHPMKTGGSSVSDVLEQLGTPVPGSDRSSIFNFTVWKLKYQEHNDNRLEAARVRKIPARRNTTVAQWFGKFKILYSHSYYRSYHRSDQGQQQTGLYKMLKENVPTKRARMITMVREPLAFTASNYNEWFCRLKKWNTQASGMKLPNNTLPNADPPGCNGYNLQDLAVARQRDNQRKCLNKTTEEIKKIGRGMRQTCRNMQKTGNLEDKPECASIPAFLESNKYNQWFHNHQTYSRCTLEANHTHRQKDYVNGALEYLGGIDTAASDDQKEDYGDMMWFGVTERMKESMCWLHFELKLASVETPRSRVQSCRPTNYWSTTDRAKFYQQEPMMVAVHRASNVVLDLQVAKMQHQVGVWLKEERAQQGNKFDLTKALESMPWVTSQCLDPNLWRTSGGGGKKR